MKKPLIIVESPTKIKTLKKYLGKDFNIAASAGHIRDLPVKELGIDIEKGFKANYVNIKNKYKIIASLKQKAQNSVQIYLAPDPDREGEAIAFHIMDILKGKDKSFHRVLINELTKKGIHDALKKTQEPDIHKYNAQKARRKLDRLVGYQISPILWRKVQGGLSAGRVQSVAVKIICDNERLIRKFIPEEFWTIDADLVEKDKAIKPFNTSLIKIENKKPKINNEKKASAIVKDLEKAEFIVHKINSKTIKKNPLPPFITSRLQQDAINRLRFSAKKTMIVAQQLYEGIEIGDQGSEGLITYMRTDSTRIAQEAAQEACSFIAQHIGKEFALKSPRFFRNKDKSQDAHEAIRPTSVFNMPEKLQRFLSQDQFKLYDLIWKRFVASQMAQALIDQKSILILAKDKYLFSVSGSTIRFQGYMKIYSQENLSNKKDILSLPDIKEKTHLKAVKLIPEQHFTKPPPRFSEASLVKELEKNGIGRPSTYAAIISTIQEKGYVDLVKRYFIPSELGFIVNDLLSICFPDVFNVSFTAKMENQLDDVANGNLQEIKLLTDFYKSFKTNLDNAADNMINVKGVGVTTDLNCPLCKKQLNIKIGKNGLFLACTGYPECVFTSNYERNEKGEVLIVQKKNDSTKVKDCIKCGKVMVQKEGRFGLFVACTGYPECRHTESANPETSNKSIGLECFETNCKGIIIEKRSKRGQMFFGCSNFPDCKFASWDKPIDRKCPECDSPYLVEKITLNKQKQILCPNKACTKNTFKKN